MSRSQIGRMNCDRLAPHYEALERVSFGRSLEHGRCSFLEHAKTSQRAVECGGGDGRFLARLLSLNPQVEVDFVDLSPKMVDLAEWRVTSLGRAFRNRVKFYVADIREFQPRPEGYDLIATHFFFDCFTQSELAPVVRRLAGWATSDANWLVSEFHEAHAGVHRLWTKAVIRSLYAGFRLTTGLKVSTLPDYPTALARAGFALRLESVSLAGLLHSSLWAPRPS
jgi:SAM-dependent methyltransferase